tara:strand:+ start:330 stop:506 length:177 start_codon:yes stop_codon:yes gene_type:complete
MPWVTGSKPLAVGLEGYFIEDFQQQTSYVGRTRHIPTKKADELRQRLRQKLKAQKESK